MKTTKYPTYTQELNTLLAEMNSANAKVAKLARKVGLGAYKSPEYTAALVAYRAYWAAVDGYRKSEGLDGAATETLSSSARGLDTSGRGL